MTVEQIFLDSAIKRFSDQKQLADKTFEQLSEDEMHYQPNTESNSVAIIIQHMHGNMLSRWTNFLTEDGEKDWRKRDDEFEAQNLSKRDLIQLWQEGWKTLLDTLHFLQPSDLLKTITIRHEPHNVVDAINRQIAHYSHHVGQIVYVGKVIKSTEWQTLSIARKASKEFNDKMMGRH